MNSPSLRRFGGSVLLAIGIGLIAVPDTATAQQYPQPPTYRYPAPAPPPPPPSVTARIKHAGRTAGDFFKRVFYGEPVGYRVPPARPSAGQPTYSLDAPPISYSGATPSNPAYTTSGYRYQTPPVEAAAAPQSNTTSSSAASSGSQATKPSTTTSVSTKKNSSSVASSSSGSSAAKKKYTPSKPSAVARNDSSDGPPKTKSSSAHSSGHASNSKSASGNKKPSADEPPSLASSPPITSYDEPALPKQTTDPATPQPTTEAKLNNTYPLPGEPETQPSLSPTINSDPINLTPTGGANSDTTTSPSSVAPSGTTLPAPDKESSPGKTTADGTKSGSFLIGKKTNKPGRVVSPYPPYNELDITGLPSGSLALDPTTQKVFEVP